MDRNSTNTNRKALQKLRAEIEKGLNSGISARSVKDIIASKRHSRDDSK